MIKALRATDNLKKNLKISTQLTES